MPPKVRMGVTVFLDQITLVSISSGGDRVAGALLHRGRIGAGKLSG